MDYLQKEEFGQKVRNRAIAINDIAISKIPRTKFNGFDNYRNKFIQERHKEILKLAWQLNDKYNTKEMEVGILVDLHSWNYWVIEGTKPREVEMRNNPQAYEAMIKSYKNQLMFLHNHPSTGTFSGADLGMFCSNETLYIMTVVGNDGCVYTLTKQAGFDNYIVTDEYTKLIHLYYQYNNNGTMAMREILKNAGKFKLDYKKGRHKG